MSAEIAEATKHIILHEPFYGNLSIAIPKIFSDRVDTACVGLRGMEIQMLINHDFFLKLTDKQRIGLVKHELLHIAFFHLFVQDEYEDPQLLNIAADICINQLIDTDYLPPKALLPNVFPELNLEPLKDTRYYYDKLKQGMPQSQKLQSLVNFMKQCNGQNPDGKPTPYDHPLWGKDENGQDVPDSVKDLAKRALEQKIKRIYEENLNKEAGNLPEHLRGVIDLFDTRPEVVPHWTDAAKLFASNSQKIRTHLSKNKLNRRFADEASYPGLRLKRKKKLIVAFDTSGSMSDSQIKEAFVLIKYIKQRLNVEVTIIEADCVIGKIWEYTGKETSIAVTGGGGTSFTEPVEYLQNNADYKGLIYFTDGYGDCGIEINKKILWVLTEDNKHFNLPGTIVRMN